ncbi:DUF445 family protein [Eubacteriaceae bacterium ES2]|nr:DUF445 family protein [Eubacteriaceae bacterium ES2]
MYLKLLAGPIIGGIIGLITNGIAIKMLFRPINPIFLFGFQIPFTPGLIPKEKPRIAKSLGQVVSTHILNEETLKKGLSSPDLDEKILLSIDRFIENHQNSTLTVKEFVLSLTGDDKGLAVLESAEVKIVDYSYAKMKKMELGPMISGLAMESILPDLNNSMFSMFISDNLIDSIRNKISAIIESLVAEQGEEVIQTIVHKETNELMALKISDLIVTHHDSLSNLKEKILVAYHQIIERHSHSIIQAVDLGKLVEDQINAFDVLTFEKLLLEIMNKELKAIILLGGLLGAIMGVIMGFM